MSSIMLSFTIICLVLAGAALGGQTSCPEMVSRSNETQKFRSEGDSNLETSQQLKNSTLETANEQKNEHQFRYYDLGEHIKIYEEPYLWRLDYVHEQTMDGFKMINKEKSVDERISNINYFANTAKIISTDINHINTGDKLLDSQIEELLADSKVNQELCGKHLDQILALMKETSEFVERMRVEGVKSNESLAEKHMRLAQFLDSFGHYEAGLFTGRSFFPGSYNQCKQTSLILAPNEQQQLVASRYCTAGLSTSKFLDARLKSRTKIPVEDRNNIYVGICLPETCHSKSFRRHRKLIESLLRTQFKLPKEFYIEEHLAVDSLFCEPTNDSEMAKTPLPGKIFLLVISSWLLVTLFCTLGGRRFLLGKKATRASQEKSPQAREPNKLLVHVVESLNLKRSWSDFIEDDAKEGAGGQKIKGIDVDPMNLVRVFCSIVVVFGHGILLNLTNLSDPTYAIHQMYYDPIILIMLNATLIIDTFQVISGILLSYLSLKKIAKLQASEESRGPEGRGWRFLKNCFMIICARYLRLLPLYASVYWFHKYVFINLNRGPFWDQGYNRYTMSGSCRVEPWHTPLTFISGFLPLPRQCLPHGWSTGTDMYSTLIAAPIIVLMYSRPKLAASIAILLSCLSSFGMFTQTILVQGEARKMIAEFKLVTLLAFMKSHSHIYTYPTYRLVSILTGVLFGYYLFSLSEGKRAPFAGRLASWANKLSVAICGSITLTPFLAAHIRASESEPNRPVDLYLVDFIFCLGRAIWSLATAILICRMLTDWKQSYFVRLSSGKFFRILNKLSYAVYLVHVHVILLEFQLKLEIPLYSSYNIIKFAFQCYLMSLAIGVVVHVMLENPIRILITGLLEPHKRFKLESPGVKEELESVSETITHLDSSQEHQSLIKRR